MRFTAPLAWCLLGTAALACRPSSSKPEPVAGPPSQQEAAATDDAPWFIESARARGLAFEQRSGHSERYLFPEIMAGGGALFDMDGDGDLDAYLVQADSLTGDGGNARNRLFRNDDGHLTDVTEGSGAGHRGYGMGVTAGDIDSDGDTDLYVTNVGANALLRNDGGGRFTDIIEPAGVGHTGWARVRPFLTTTETATSISSP